METPRSDFSSRRRLNQTLVANEVADCDDDMSSLQRALIDLKYKRMALNTKLNSVNDLMSELPLEVITEIFQLVVDSQEASDLSSLPTQFLLGKICKSWRDTAWKHSALWKDIRIQLIAEKYPKQEELLVEWLDRSGTRPITVSVASKNGWQPPQSFATLLLGTSQRWTAFTCASPLSSLSQGLAADPPPSFPLLSKISVSADGIPQSESATPYKFASSPLLRHFFSSNIRLYHISCSYRFLTTLTLQGLSGAHALTFIRVLQNIEKLTLYLNKGSTNQVAQHTTLKILPSLNYLCLYADNTDATAIFDSITAPALSDLRLCISSTVPANLKHTWITSLDDMCERSAFSLSNLSLGGIGIGQEGTLVGVVGSFPTLSSLHVKFPGGRNNFVLSDMTINRLNPEAFPAFLPTLEIFSFKGQIDFKPTKLLTTLEKRLEASKTNASRKPLRAIKITYTNAQWAQTGENGNPNRVWAFHRGIAYLAARGVDLDVKWDEENLNAQAR